MTVWAKLQSWLGASASDVAIDNEFNNIYLGLNEAANGNLPSGYNKVGLTFTGASLTIKGETKIGNTNVPLDSALTVSGLAGWRYIITTSGGVMSVESIPPAEITADTQVYTPTPVFNVVNNGYYSTVNTARRIVGVCYFDTTIKEVIAYGDGYKKNDDYWETTQPGISATTAGTRLQFTGTWEKTWGTNIVCVDNGGYVTGNDNEGFRITFQKSGKGRIGVTCTQEGTGTALHKNGSLYKQYLFSSLASNSNAFISIDVSVSAGDYFTFVNVNSSVSAVISYFTITFEEN